MLRSRYVVTGTGGPVGFSELTQFLHPDGSRTYLVRERLEFWGPVLDRFVFVTFDPAGNFDSGAWVGSSEYSVDFCYLFSHDGKAIRGSWEGSVLGTCWNSVPCSADAPLLGFWGPLESLLLSRYDEGGPKVQTLDAVDVEDMHHRRMQVQVERVGTDAIRVPAGQFSTTKYRSERFGSTHHWIDENGTLICWASEENEYRWELESYPEDKRTVVSPGSALELLARGVYSVSSPSNGPHGDLPWSLAMDPTGRIHVLAEEHLGRRTSRFQAVLGAEGRWKYVSESCHWNIGEGAGAEETHYFETFFFRNNVYLLRLRPGAFPFLQKQSAIVSSAFHSVNYPVVSTFWLQHLSLSPGQVHHFPRLVHIANRYRGACLEVQPATAERLVGTNGPSFDGATDSGHYKLSYAGGWVNSTFECWTDQHLVPQKAQVVSGEGVVDYELTDYEVRPNFVEYLMGRKRPGKPGF